MHRPRHARLKYYHFLSSVFPLISFKLGKETRVLTVSTLVQYSTRNPSNKRKIKKIQIAMDRIKIFLFTGSISLYLGDFTTSPENF